MPKNTPTNYREKLEIEKEKKQRAKFKKLKALKKLRKDDDSFQSVSSHKPIDNVGTPNKTVVKYDPLFKAKQQKAEVEEQNRIALEEREEKERILKKKLEQRKQTSVRLNKKTRSGQPVTKNILSHLLNKLENKS